MVQQVESPKTRNQSLFYTSGSQCFYVYARVRRIRVIKFDVFRREPGQYVPSNPRETFYFTASTQWQKLQAFQGRTVGKSPEVTVRPTHSARCT